MSVDKIDFFKQQKGCIPIIKMLDYILVIEVNNKTQTTKMHLCQYMGNEEAFGAFGAFIDDTDFDGKDYMFEFCRTVSFTEEMATTMPKMFQKHSGVFKQSFEADDMDENDTNYEFMVMHVVGKFHTQFSEKTFKP